MAFEELPADYAKFFETGELPATLAAEHTPPAEAPAPAAPEVPAQAPETPQTTPEATTPTEIDPPPQAPSTNPYLERLLAEKDASEAALRKQLEELNSKVEKMTAVPPPDPNNDPLGYLKHQIEQANQKLEAMQAEQGKTAQLSQEQKQQAELANHINSQVAAFEKTHSDYGDAYKHLVNMRMQDFRDLGLTEQQAQTAMDNEARGIMAQALKTQKNPAELAYNMAKRYGFQAKAPTPTAENKLETIKKGLEASGGLDRSTPPGATSVSLDNVKNMSDRDLNQAVANDWEKIFGGKKGIFF